ncbi:hypothetical protein K437DRAFT_217549, partial [Tilletiaria anomala UBC 951]
LADVATSFKACKGDVPPPLVVRTSASGGPRIYLFGGRLVTTRCMTNDLYELDIDTVTWRKVKPGQLNPDDARYFHSADLWDGKLIICSGMGYPRRSDSSDGLSVLDEVIALDLATLTWDLDFAAAPSTSTAAVTASSSAADMRPLPRYAHLSSTTSDHLVILGGQDIDNKYVEQIAVFSLRQRCWVRCDRLNSQCGSYRSLAVSGAWCIQDESGREQRAGEGLTPITRPCWMPSPAAAEATAAAKAQARATEAELMPIYVYSNYNFADVKRELERIQYSRSASDEALSLATEDLSPQMVGVSLPPGLRFPNGFVLGSHLIISGTYLANTSQTFSIWALHLPTLTWSRMDGGSVLAHGSWNRAILWPKENRLLVLGNRERDLVADYNHRQTNWDHIALLELEPWGIYQPPPFNFHWRAATLGLEKLGDFEIVCSDGTKLGVNRAVLERRWAWFKRALQDYRKRASDAAQSQATKDGVSVPTYIIGDDGGKIKADIRITPRQLFLPEPSPVVVALLEFFHTQTICTSLQRHPSMLATLLIIAAMYEIPGLTLWTNHAIHQCLTRELSPSTKTLTQVEPTVLPAEERHRLAILLYEAASLCGRASLQVRALRVVM